MQAAKQPAISHAELSAPNSLHSHTNKMSTGLSRRSCLHPALVFWPMGERRHTARFSASFTFWFTLTVVSIKLRYWLWHHNLMKHKKKRMGWRWGNNKDKDRRCLFAYYLNGIGKRPEEAQHGGVMNPDPPSLHTPCCMPLWWIIHTSPEAINQSGKS